MTKEQPSGLKVTVLSLICLCLTVLPLCYYEKRHRPEATAEDETDTTLIKLHYEHSDDLVDELGGFQLYGVYRVRCNDGKVRSVKVALLDRKLDRAGIVVVPTGVTVVSNVGAKGYQANGVGFVELSWLRERLVQE